MARPEEIALENKKIRELQRTVDLALLFLDRGAVDRAEAERIMEKVREKALRLFPEKGETFDLIYHPRFMRVIHRRFGRQ